MADRIEDYLFPGEDTDGFARRIRADIEETAVHAVVALLNRDAASHPDKILAVYRAADALSVAVDDLHRASVGQRREVAS